MISTHIDPFVAFCKDLAIPGLDVHLYRGANAFGCLLNPAVALPSWWPKENVYFLAGVKPGIEKRAADVDVLKRGMFTLDFDIRKELEKDGRYESNMANGIAFEAERIVSALEKHPAYKNFRYIVMSGNGMHVHYFGEPAELGQWERSSEGTESWASFKEEWVQGMKGVFEEVAKITPIQPDFGCGNAGRIMRMPGSWNVKDPTNRKPVEIVAWMPGASVGNLGWILEGGRVRIARHEAKQAQEKADFVSRGGEESGLIALINSVPIEQVVQQLTGCTVRARKKDGGLRFADDKGEERGFFKHHALNIIIHEGTSLFPAPEGKGYNCLGLVKAVLKLSTHDAVEWFAERSTPIRELKQKEREAWIKAHGASETQLYEEKISSLPHA